jgi:GNAT superfamily N-acetyltransferase
MLRRVSRPATNLPFSLRLARSGELRELVAIDDAASSLFAEAGLVLDLGHEHPFVEAEVGRWAFAIENGLAHVAVDAEDRPLAFMTLGVVDGAPYLDQLAVRPRAMRHGMGGALIARALEWSEPHALWLTTYGHLPWNRPYHERHGFVVVADHECGPELREILELQRAVLPAPKERVAMVCRRDAPEAG